MNMRLLVSFSFVAVGLISARNGDSVEPNMSSRTSHHSWFGGNFENLVVFGDSYTDESRLDYFTTHNNTPPPVGLLLPESFDASDGGRVWPRCMYGSFWLICNNAANERGHRRESIFRRETLRLCYRWRGL
jgi:hypothetical protein